jgi:hypothetical protein
MGWSPRASSIWVAALGGRSIFFAPRFEELIGYEVIAQVQSAAADQLARVRVKQPVFERTSLVCADATTATPFDRPLVLFMYNPFGQTPMARLCQRLREAHCEVHLYYVNPVLEGMITGALGPPAEIFRCDFPIAYFHFDSV